MVLLNSMPVGFNLIVNSLSSRSQLSRTRVNSGFRSQQWSCGGSGIAMSETARASLGQGPART